MDSFPSSKGQLNSEWIYEVIISPKIPTKNYRDFFDGSLLEGREEISDYMGFGKNCVRKVCISWTTSKKLK